MATPALDPVPAASPGANKWVIAVAVSLAALLEIIDTNIVNVALADIQASTGATLSQVSWLISGYGIANVIILPLSAWLGSRFGKKRYFLFSAIGFTLASVLCGAATSFEMLVAARILQGLTGGGLLAKAQAILFETFSRAEQAMAQALFGAIVLGGPAIGPTLGGYIVTHVGWRWIFFVNVPLAAIAIIMAAVALPKDPRHRTRTPIDWTAIALLAIGLGSLQWVLEEGQTSGWFDSRFVTALAIVAAAGIVAFVIRQLRSDAPVVDLRVLRYRSLWSGCVLSMVVGMVFYAALFAIPLFASASLRYSSQQIGLLLLPGALASAVAMPVAAKLMARVDPRALILAGGATLLVGMNMLIGLSPQTGGDDLFFPLIIRTFGAVLVFLPLQLAALGSLPHADLPAATGLFNLMRQLGGSISVALLTTLLDQRMTFHQAILREKLAASDPNTLAHVGALARAFLARGVDATTAHDRAVALLAHSVEHQAAVMSFGDSFWIACVLVVMALPLVFLMRRPISDPRRAGR